MHPKHDYVQSCDRTPHGLHCEKCQNVYCSKCEGLAHDGYSCTDAKQLVEDWEKEHKPMLQQKILKEFAELVENEENLNPHSIAKGAGYAAKPNPLLKSLEE